MQNASRRGAADMGMPLMIVAFIVIGGFMYWLSGQAAAERASRVVEEAPPEEQTSTPMGGVDLGEVTAIGTDPTAFEGETISGQGYEIASLFGTAGFWVNTAGGNPFLVVFTEELRATGITVAQGDYIDATGEMLAMDVSFLDEWLAEGLITENDKIIGEFATHFVAAGEVTVVDPPAGAEGEGAAGEGADAGQ